MVDRERRINDGRSVEANINADFGTQIYNTVRDNLEARAVRYYDSDHHIFDECSFSLPECFCLSCRGQGDRCRDAAADRVIASS